MCAGARAFRSLWFPIGFKIKSNTHTHKLQTIVFDSLIHEHRLSALFNVLLHRLRSINAIEMERWICSGRNVTKVKRFWLDFFWIFAATITNSRHRNNCNCFCLLWLRLWLLLLLLLLLILQWLSWIMCTKRARVQPNQFHHQNISSFVPLDLYCVFAHVSSIAHHVEIVDLLFQYYVCVCI